MLHAGNNLVSLGRSKGLRITLISQRPAKLHKDSLTQVQSMVAMRLMAPQDRKAVSEWIADQADAEKGKEIVASLPSLRPGEAWVWAPEASVLNRVKFALPKTFDSSRAPTMADGAGPQLAPINLDALKGRLGTVEAETKANDPRALQAEIARLKREVAAKPVTTVADPQAVATAERAGYERGHADGYAHAINGVVAESSAVIGAIDNARAAAAQIAEWARRPAPTPAARPTAPSPVRIMSNPVATVPAEQFAGRVSPTVRKILDVIHRANPMALSFDAAARRAAVSKQSSAYRSYLAAVIASGEVQQREDGRLYSSPGFAAPTGPGIDPVEEFASKLPPSFGRMLREIASTGTPLSRDEIAARANISPTSSGLGSGLNELLKLGLIEDNDGCFQLHRDLAA